MERKSEKFNLKYKILKQAYTTNTPEYKAYFLMRDFTVGFPACFSILEI